MDKEFPGSRENLDLAVQYHASVTKIIHYIPNIKFHGRNMKYDVFREDNCIFMILHEISQENHDFHQEIRKRDAAARF